MTAKSTYMLSAIASVCLLLYPQHSHPQTSKTPPKTLTLKQLQQRIKQAPRPAQDRRRDTFRRPAQVLHTLGIQAGWRVAEMMAGRGYYAEILSHVLGPQDKVYAHNNRFVRKRFADKAIYKALKPGGLYAVIDHSAKQGAGAKEVKRLHRIEASMVKQEILAAGFRLHKTSSLLRNPKDQRNTNVFRPSIRGRTDRFFFIFQKPTQPTTQKPEPSPSPRKKTPH